MTSKADAIDNYILGKDCNRPFRLDNAFAESATLKMVVQTESITFPPSLIGREPIADTLVRQFNQQYENIHTICIGARPEIDSEKFSCHWMVVMSEKKSGVLRVGCGHYDWEFCHSTHLIQDLVITIDFMEFATVPSLAPAMLWVSSLPYPWCDIANIAKNPPNIPALLRVVNHLSD
ncbi:hypothetical protein N9850_07645 [Granulosicoccus sp.]|nr:hypothetical protein [Granulosicoccus sp.]MDB4223633.1 hypothetical protein [Granulosicoccus sp.]